MPQNTPKYPKPQEAASHGCACHDVQLSLRGTGEVTSCAFSWATRLWGPLALLKIDSVGCTPNHTFVRNFLCSLNFSLQPFHSESVEALLTPELLREALNHQIWAIHGLPFLQGLFPSGPKEFIRMEHWDFPLWASPSAVDVSCHAEHSEGGAVSQVGFGSAGVQTLEIIL